MATVLIVDDREANRKLLVGLLEGQGHRLLQAADGAEALQIARSSPCDLIVTDVLMPVMDGFELVRQVRSEPRTAAAKVMFFTAHYPEHRARELAEACGVDRILTRPCSSEEVVRAIAALLEQDAPPRRPVPPDVAREHSRLLMDKLAQKTGQLRIAVDRLTTLVEADRKFAQERDPARLMQHLCDAARFLLGARLASAAAGTEPLLPPRHFSVSGDDAVTAAGLEPQRLSDGIPGSVMRERRPQRVARQGIAAGLPAGHLPADALLCAPLTSPTRAYGWVCVTDKLGAAEFSEEDEALLEMLAALAGRLYENGILYADLRRHAEQLHGELVQSRRAEAQLRLANAELEQRLLGAVTR